MSSTSRSRTSITAAPRPRARRPMESASASIAPSWMSSIGWRSVKRSITPSTSCRPTLMLGSPNTTTTAPIRAAGASARPRCRPFLTRYHWQRRNSWPHDHGRQPYTGSHSQHRLSDQVSANTVYALRPEAIALLPAPDAPAAPRTSQQPVIAPRLSIVVLPFANLSSDTEQQYFADGITEDL